MKEVERPKSYERKQFQWPESNFTTFGLYVLILYDPKVRPLDIADLTSLLDSIRKVYEASHVPHTQRILKNAVLSIEATSHDPKK